MEEDNVPNRQRYNELRNKYREKLLRSVDPTELLLSDLCMIETFSSKVSDIRPMKITEKIADEVLSLPLDENFVDTIGPFMSVLKRNGHAHVASVFINGSDEELLADDKYHLLNDKLTDLCTYLDPDCGIIPSMISARVFSTCDKERVLACETENDKAGEIITILSRRSNSCYISFVSILQEMDQEHILYILNENGSPPISKVHLKLINKQRGIIVKHVDSVHMPFVDTLVSLDVFTDIDRQRVEAMGQVRFKRNQQIVNILLRKSQRRFDKFLVALLETSQGDLIRLFGGLTIKGRLHVNLSPDSLTQIRAVETLLRTTLESDLRAEESPLRNELGGEGIYAGSVKEGSIRIWFKFLTRETLEIMRSDKLDTLFTDIYCKMFSDKGLQSIHVEIPEAEFERCEQIFGALMKPEHQKALQRAQESIADKIRVDEDLLKWLSLHACHRDAILNQSSDEDKVKVLLDVMTCRPDCEFQQLMNALRNTQQDNAANFIMGKNIVDLLVDALDTVAQDSSICWWLNFDDDDYDDNDDADADDDDDADDGLSVCRSLLIHFRQ